MTDRTYLKALTALKAERESLLDKRDEIDSRLSCIEAAIDNLRVVVFHDQPFEGGLTEAVRTTLKRNAGRSLSPTDVRDGLKEIGYETSKHSNIMASVHSVLKRLVESGDAKSKEIKNDGGTRYYWAQTLSLHDLASGSRIVRGALSQQYTEDALRGETIGDVFSADNLSKLGHSLSALSKALPDEDKPLGAPKKK